MQSDHIRRFVRGMSVVASSSMLVLAAIGSVSAHPLSITSSTGVDAGREALIALISRYEPFEDAESIEALADEVLLAWPNAGAIAFDLLDDSDHEDEADESDESDDEADEADEDEADEADESDDEADEADEADDDEADEADEADDDESDDDEDGDEDESEDDESDDDED